MDTSTNFPGVKNQNINRFCSSYFRSELKKNFKTLKKDLKISTSRLSRRKKR